MSKSRIENWRERSADKGCSIGQLVNQEYDQPDNLVVLVTGNNQPPASLAGMVKAYAKKRKRAISVDVNSANHTYTIPGYADNLEIAIQRATDGRPVDLLGGHSLGGLVAMELASRRPELIKQVGLMATVPRGLPSQPISYSTAANMLRPSWYEGIARRYPTYDEGSDAVQPEVETKIGMFASLRQSLAYTIDVTTQANPFLATQNHTQPTIVIGAKNDKYVPIGNIRALGRRPNTVWIELDGDHYDHMFPLDQSAETVECLEYGSKQLQQGFRGELLDM